MRTYLAAVCLLFVLLGCGSGDPAPSVERVASASLLVPCAAPVSLSTRDLTGAEVEILWGRDRSALRACASRHRALANLTSEATIDD